MRAASEKKSSSINIRAWRKISSYSQRFFNIDITARRVMFNKTLNAGQICLAPDYVYVHETEKDNFVEACKNC